MKRSLVLSILSISLLCVAACNQDESIRTSEPPPPQTGAPLESAAQRGGFSGTVVEAMNAADYTYVEVDTGHEKLWAATPAFQVKVGDRVVVPEGMPMRNYHSKTLDRDFEVVYFVQSILSGPGDRPPQGPAAADHPSMAGHGRASAASVPHEIDFSGIAKAEGGQTVAELHATKVELAGQQVSLRGKVVKFNSQIMARNWLHVQDGSGDVTAGTHDVTVTTDVPANVGDTVLVRGRVVLDKDFGFGYKYNLIIEDAQVTVE